ncbi:hypothetical protein FA95DRAFT_123782 [Auriscalpium vulgare]|uniref:Uncharacterized protein n=1 Tax=Auriscalpium vulgare TaxID=40419 RepID=A0ACB8RNA1_9AGAM|nr:hypothetical protein FA95DRAFT_123782 [Auriscalpium vulgare]
MTDGRTCAQDRVSPPILRGSSNPRLQDVADPRIDGSCPNGLPRDAKGRAECWYTPLLVTIRLNARLVSEPLLVNASAENASRKNSEIALYNNFDRIAMTLVASTRLRLTICAQRSLIPRLPLPQHTALSDSPRPQRATYHQSAGMIISLFISMSPMLPAVNCTSIIEEKPGVAVLA